MGHTSLAILEQKLNEARKLVAVGSQYYHWRKPDHSYVVTGLSICEWDEQVVVNYRDAEESENVIPWVRRLTGEDGWLTPATNDLGQPVARFTQVK